MRSFPCRCQRSACRARRTLAKHPSEYVKRPVCHSCGSPCPCGKKRTHIAGERCGLRPSLIVDRYRAKIETRLSVCRPGRGGCDEYSFPHAKGRGWCRHNPNITPAMLADRFETMGARAA